MPALSPLDLESLLDALKDKRPQVALHSRRVAQYAVMLAAHCGLGMDLVEKIRLGALLHDVGKLLVPAAILNKVGTLSRRQEQELRIHPDLGVELAGRAGLPDEVCRIILHHHERHDGQGYPDRRVGADTPIAIRIVSVMNAFDFLVHPPGEGRPCSVEQARTRIAGEAGTRFCPWAVSGLLALPASLLHLAPDEHAGPFMPDGRPDPCGLLATRRWVARRTRSWS